MLLARLRKIVFSAANARLLFRPAKINGDRTMGATSSGSRWFHPSSLRTAASTAILGKHWLEEHRALMFLRRKLGHPAAPALEVQSIVRAMGWCCGLWQTVHSWWLVLASAAANWPWERLHCLGNERARSLETQSESEPKTKPEPKVATLTGLKLLVPEENLFFISCFWM
jgi:hypothetical protein